TKAEGIMFSLQDRQNRLMALGPTHEEVITTIARELIKSYRQLPVNLYQIQTKFRDEIRPRFGLLRAREFIMKDGYSFHTSWECLQKTYARMEQAYRNIFTRCGLTFKVVEADSGAIGGAASQEFMVLANAGEDEILYTDDGAYAANVEKAVSLPTPPATSPFDTYQKKETPNCETIAKVCDFLQCSETIVVKNVLYQALYDSGKTVLVLVSIRGDQEVNEVKLANQLSQLASQYEAKSLISLKVADEISQSQWAAKPLPLGYIAPDLPDDYILANETVVGKFLRLADHTVVELNNFVTGANEPGYHVVGANWGKEFTLPPIIADLRKAKAGDRAIHNPQQTLKSTRGIEVGHIFQLGTKYSTAMEATYTDEDGCEKPFIMGC
ncbi:MAG TPA: proline--tRNA ligase, partial [Geminocystis sp. M7585_C2015_104]|nr:proline--tRNA ligase [Geminocystis sp. M7585_C2015_104]